ncbi:MAG: hypothetical protein K6F49_12325 [Saccharofermentans sp.]|nr:hypothetical protein [Saccharofermentans sp.]
MKKTIIVKRLTAAVLAATLMVSVASCSSDSEEEETTTTTTTASEETSEETTTTEETTEETSEETSSESSEETSSEETVIDDPEVAMYNDPEVRSWASWYINNGYDIEYMDHEAGESFWGEGTNMVEGFGAAEPGDNLFTIDYVMKFPDYESADAFLNELDGSDFGDVVRTENGDGSCTFEVEGGMWYGSLSTNNVIVFVCNEDFEG